MGGWGDTLLHQIVNFYQTLGEHHLFFQILCLSAKMWGVQALVLGNYLPPRDIFAAFPLIPNLAIKNQFLSNANVSGGLQTE